MKTKYLLAIIFMVFALLFAVQARGAVNNPAEASAAVPTNVVFRADLGGEEYYPDWFKWSLSKFTAAVPDSTTVLTNKDRIIYKEVFFATAQNYSVAYYSITTTNQLAMTLSSDDAGIATTDVSTLYYVADGSVEVSATLGSFSRKTNLTFSVSGATNETTFGCVTGTFLNAISHGIDDRLLAGKTTSVYSVQNHAATNYVRNTNCWAYGLNLTSISPWNSYAGQYRAGTLISSNILLTSQHWNLPVGTSIRFITSSNTVISRTVVSNKNLSASARIDVTVSKLSAPISTNEILPAVFLPNEYYNYFPTDDYRSPGFFVNQTERAIVSDIIITGYSSGAVYISCLPAAATNRVAWAYPGVTTGDSSSPMMFSLAGYDRPILLAVGNGLGHHFFGDENLNAIVAAITELGGDSNITRVNLGSRGFTDFEPKPPQF